MLGGCVAASIVLSGCLVSFDGTQVEIDGPVKLSSVHCFPDRYGRTSPSDASCTEDAVEVGGEYQFLLAYRVDDVLDAPATITATEGERLTFRRSDQYSDELARIVPAVAGQHWVGYVGDAVQPSRQGIAISPDFALRVAEGRDVPVTVDSIVTLGVRFVAFEGWGISTVDPSDPVSCPTSSEIADAVSDGQPRIDTICSLDDLATVEDRDKRQAFAAPGIVTGVPSTSTYATYNSLTKITTTLFDAKVTPAVPVDVVAGATAATRFDIVGRAPIGRSQDVDVRVETSIPGAAATASRATATISNVVVDPITASIAVPATTPAGTYTATLHLVSRGFTLRSATATIRVVDAPAQAPAAGGGAAGPQSAAFVAAPKLVHVDRTPPHFKSISWPKRMTRAQLRRHGIAIHVVQTERAKVVETLAHFETENGRKLTRVGMTTVRKEDGRVIKFKFRPTYAGWKVLGATGGIKLRITFRLTDKAGHTWTVKRPVMLF